MTNRLLGATIVLVLGAAALIPVSLLTYVPAYFFGAVLIYIGFAMTSEWLWHSRKKLDGVDRAISDCHFSVQLNHFIPGFLSYSVPVSLK